MPPGPSPPHIPGAAPAAGSTNPELRLVAWETTRNCNLSCVHCRASATLRALHRRARHRRRPAAARPDRRTGRPIVILTGGEPLLREDIFEIAALRHRPGPAHGHGAQRHPDHPRKSPGPSPPAGIQRISISLDGATPPKPRRLPGGGRRVRGRLRGIECRVPPASNFRSTPPSPGQPGADPAIQKLAESLGAVAHHIFLLVPTGRGKYIVDQAIDAASTRPPSTGSTISAARPAATQSHLRPPLLPHPAAAGQGRRQAVTFQTHGLDAVTRGCLGGTGFCFISHTGIVQPCGFLNTNCGDVTTAFPLLLRRDLAPFGSLSPPCATTTG
jgi:AdoMet-dependent heme synthase